MSPSIVKSVSLDPHTAELASRIPNFSRFVRECLIRHFIDGGGEWLQCKREDDDSRLCIPMQEPRCMKCWPCGPPPREAWIAYVRPPRTHDAYGKELSKFMIEPNPDYMDHTVVLEAAEAENPKLFSFEDMTIKGNAKPQPKPAKPKGWLRRWISG
ncbi:MAG TPA: hypothetical protein EYO33_33565 [Phycisphaerales bacterium]|nr:hypothetical protein [Phycisphaerales bacterium]